MKKHYASIVLAIACIVIGSWSDTVQAQTTNPHLNSVFTPFTRTKLYAWSDPLESYIYNGAYSLPFRIMLPNNFVLGAHTQKYPILIFLHGRGETAGYDPALQDNEKQLLHGGQISMKAVQNNSFPGFLLYPQGRDNPNPCGTGTSPYVACQWSWGPDKITTIKDIVDILVTQCDVDPDRIYISGLSGGGQGSWFALTQYPEYFAAAHIMSAAGGSFTPTNVLPILGHIPYQLSQGGLDADPDPSQGKYTTEQIRGFGGNIIYNYYPTLAHNTWDSEYAKSDYFTWFLNYRKTDILVKNGQTSFCPGDAINVVLGVSKNSAVTNNRITNYEWQYDTGSGYVAFPGGNGASVNEITVTTPGSYRVRYTRPNLPAPFTGLSAWSTPVVIDNNKPLTTPTPIITTNGKSTTLPSLDGSPDVALYGPANKASYLWSPSGATTPNYTASTAGNYSVTTKEPAGSPLAADGYQPVRLRANPQGCATPSNTICVTTQDGAGSPAPPTNFFAAATSQTSIQLSWDDRATNETGFEIYRTVTPGSGYSLVALLPSSVTANPQLYSNTGLQAGVTYYYRMRAVNCSGGSAYTTEISANTSADATPPTAPVLSSGATSRTAINLSWTGATDNVGVTQYDVYQNGSLIGSTATTSYVATSLVALSVYNYVVKAKDAAGNVSPPSNQVNVTAANTGLFYSYYTHTGITSTTAITTDGTLVKTGTINNFLTTPRTQTDNYAFIYEGFINIPTSGNYTFFTTSDDGSQLFINNVLNVNNDGLHGGVEKAGTVINLSAGSYPIKVTYFEATGGESIAVKWQGPGITKVAIPDAVLKDNVTPPAALTAPTNFTATAATYSQINISWKDGSNNETGFEISRSLTTNGTYQVVYVAPAQTGTLTPSAAGTGTIGNWSNTGLAANTNYYYKIRALNASSSSALVGPATAKTLVAPTTPGVPAGFTATPISATQVNLAWNTTANAISYEIQKSTNLTTGFTTITTVTAPTLTYSDTQLNGHATVYYRIRALGNGGTSSAYSTPAIQAITPNRAPAAFDIPNQTITADQATPAQTFTTTITDADGDPIAFTVTGLPTGASYTDNGYGKITFSFVSVGAGSYPIAVQASDGIATVSDNFTLTSSTNHNPVITNVSINGVSTATSTIPSLTTEEGRTLTVAITVTDADGNAQLVVSPLSPAVGGYPPYASISNPPIFTAPTTSGTINAVRVFTLTFTPSIGQAKIYNDIVLTLKDNAGGINVQTFSLTVAAIDKYFTMSLNFATDGPHAENSPWNNISIPTTGGLSNLKDDQGANVRFVTFNPLTQGSVMGGAIGVLPASPSLPYTVKVRESTFRRNSNYTEMKFQNLNPALQYNIILYGAYPESAGVVTQTKYTVTGATAQTPLILNTANGLATPVTLPSAINASASNEITIRVEKGTTNTGFFYINSAILTAIYQEPIAPAAPSLLGLTATLYNKVDLTWTDNSYNETGFKIYRSTTSANGPWGAPIIVPANQTTYTDATTVGRVTYYYKVSAYNGFGDSAEPNPTGIVTTPNGAPVVANPGTITVRAGLTLQTNISASDPEGDAVSFSVLNLPPFATLVDNGNNTGFIRFTPQLSDVGSYILTLKGVDAFSGSMQLNFTLLVLDPEVDEAVYLNFTSTAAGNASAPWNNIPINVLGTTLKNNLGVNSAITITSAGGWTNNLASDNAGTTTASNSGVYPDKVLQSFWATSNITPSTATFITLSGLDNAKRYNITVLGSRNEFWFADAIYTIGTAKTLHTSKNTTNTIHFTGLAPVSGSITLNVQKPVNVNTSPVVSHRDAPLNAMVIEGYTPGTPRRPTNLVAKGKTKTSIDLTWNDNSSNEDGFEIYRATSQAGPFNLVTTTLSNVESYTDAGLTQNTAYVYHVRAKTLPSTYSAYTEDAIVSTYNQVILVNINSAASVGHLQAPKPPWNNTAAPPETGLLFKNFITDTNTPTPVDLEIVQFGGGGPNNTGFLTGNNSGVYPDAVLQNYYYFEQLDPATQYTLRSLDKNFDYELIFMGNEWYQAVMNGAASVSDFTVNGNTQSQFNGKNVSERVFFRNIHPEPDSTISFQVGANDAVLFGVWNALEIRSYTPLSASFDTQAPTIPQNLVASNITDVSVKLTWKHASDNIGVTGYEVFQGSTLVTTVSDTTTTVLNLQPQTTYLFSVRALDLKGNHSGFSNTVQITTLNSSTQAIYYRPIAVGDISNVTSWVDSVGHSPVDFISNNQIFFLNRNASLDTDLTISGSNTKLIVDNGKTLTLNNNLTTVVEAGANASVIVNAATSPQFGKLAPTSTVTFSGNPNAVPGASYGNIMLTGSSTTKNFSAGTYTVNGNLNIDNGVALSGSTNNSTQLNVSGDLTLVGTATMPTDNQLFSVNFNSGGVQKLTANQLNIRFYNLHVSNQTQLNVITSGALANTVTLGTALGGGLTIDSASVFNLAKNSLTIQGAGTINGAGQQGKIKSTKGSISVLSSGNQVSNLYFEAGADTVKTVGVNANAAAQVNVKTKMYVSEVVNMNNGKLNSAGNVVLVSDANGTARIASILNSGVVLGSIEFQRYINPKGKVWRYLSTPVYDTKISDWQTYIPITGNFTGTSTGIGLTKTPSLYYYDESNAGYIAYPFTNNQEKLDVGLGYSIFVREGVNPTKLRLTGPVQQGNFTFNILSFGASGDTTTGWNLLGNPYPAPIEWNNANWQSTGMDGSVSVRDNYYQGNLSTGRFMVWNKNGIGDSEFKGIISPGQAFWVRSNGDDTPSLQVNENIKYDSVRSGFFRTVVPKNHFSLVLTSGGYLDKTFIHFTDGATDNIDHGIDAIKNLNDVFNFSTLSQNKSLSINSLPENFCSKSIWLNLADMSTGNYTLRAKDLSSFDYDVTIKLVDHFNSTEFVMDETSAYTFNVTSTDATTFGKKRFELVVAKPAIRTDVVVDAQPETLCEGSDGRVTLSNTQPGATYKLLSNNKELGSFTSSGDKLNIDLNDANLSYGNNVIQLKAAFPGCDASSIPATLAVNYKQTFAATASGKIICEGDSATLRLATDAPTGSTYKWYNDASSQNAIATSSAKEFNTSKLVATTHYFVSVSSNGCESSQRNEVVVEVEHLTLPQVLAQGLQLISNNKNGNQWNYNSQPISGATDVLYVPTKSGNYSVTVAEGACEKTSGAVEFIVTSLESEETAQLSLHPNPVKNRMLITLTAGVVENSEVNMYIYNAQGILVRKIQRTYQKDGMDISASDLSSGFYLMIIESNGKIAETRFVKE